MAPSNFESGLDDRGADDKKRERIAHLKITLNGAKGIPAAHFENSGTVGTTDTYCVVSVERMKRSTSVIRKSLNPTWNQEMPFPVTDLNADIVIQLYSMKSIGGLDVDSKLIGQAIVPVSRLLPNLCSLELIASSFLAGKDVTPTRVTLMQEDLELFPLPKELSRFQAIPKELALDLKGMTRPRASLGIVRVQIELTLTAPLIQLYASIVPAAPSSRLTPGQTSNKSDPEVLDFNVIKWNCHRIRAAIMHPPAWTLAVDELRNWERPVPSLCAFVATIVTILVLPIWLIPTAAAALAILLSVYGARIRPRSSKQGGVETWHPLVERDEKEPHTIVGKALLGKALVLRVQACAPAPAATTQLLCSTEGLVHFFQSLCS